MNRNRVHFHFIFTHKQITFIYNIAANRILPEKKSIKQIAKLLTLTGADAHQLETMTHKITEIETCKQLTSTHRPIDRLNELMR